MKILKEISDKSLGLSDFEILNQNFKLRKSARAILKNDKGEIAIQYLANHFFHKLPGGGVEPGETVEQALVREIKEEVGCDITIEKEVGMVIEYREEHQIIHISYCYVTNVLGGIGESTLEQAEINEGMSTIWITPQEAIQKMEVDVPNTYQGEFILARELAFLHEFVALKQ